MKAGLTKLDPMMVKRAQVSGTEQVRYRVYQSPTEYIAVIAESALLALRIAGVKHPYKVVRDLPTSGVAVEKGILTVPENSEKIPLPTAQLPREMVTMEPEAQHVSEPFVEMGLAEIHKKRMAAAGVLSRDEGVGSFGVPDNAPTLTPSVKPAPSAPPPLPISVAPPEPQINTDSGVLSQEDIAKLLGDV